MLLPLFFSTSVVSLIIREGLCDNVCLLAFLLAWMDPIDASSPFGMNFTE